MRDDIVPGFAPHTSAPPICRSIVDDPGPPATAGPLSWLYKQASSFAWDVKDISGMPSLGYTIRERASLLLALRARGHDTDLFNFQVSYLSKEPFRYLLRELFFKKEYVFEAETDSPVILDCGANIGLTTLFFKRLYPKARISSFEADPTTASILQKNIEQNHLDHVSAYNLMLSNGGGDRPFYIAANVSGSLRMSASPERLSDNREIIVRAGKLSDYIDGPVDFLKLDVEGAEFEVMADLVSSRTILQIRRMVIEYHHKIGGKASCLAKFLGLLEEEGFEYQISGSCDAIGRQNVFQDVIIGAYRLAS